MSDAIDLALEVLDSIATGTHEWDRMFGVLRIVDMRGPVGVHEVKAKARAAAKALRKSAAPAPRPSPEAPPAPVPPPGARAALKPFLTRCPATRSGRLPPDEVSDCEFCVGTAPCADFTVPEPPDLTPLPMVACSACGLEFSPDLGDGNCPEGHTAPRAAPPPGARGDPTHRCKLCGALWRLNEWPFDWTLYSAKAGPCCDNQPMGDQIEPITGFRRLCDPGIMGEPARAAPPPGARATNGSNEEG